jgi:hypothetical protein
MKSLILFLFFITNLTVASDFSYVLKLIEQGKISEANQVLQKMKVQDGGSAEYFLLDALLTENGKDAEMKYIQILEQFSNFKYNEIVYFRLYSFNYAIGNYTTAEKYYSELKNRFPSSNYLSAKSEITEKPNQLENQAKSEYLVQLAAYLTEANADNLSQKAIKSGYKSRLERKNVDGKIFYVVIIGNFSDKIEAINAKKKVDYELKINSKIEKIETTKH